MHIFEQSALKMAKEALDSHPVLNKEKDTYPDDIVHQYFMNCMTLSDTSWLAKFERYNPIWLPPYLFKRHIFISLNTDDSESLKSNFAADISLHILIDMFFATIVSAPILSQGVNTLYTGNSMAFTIMLHFTLSVQLASITCAVLYSSSLSSIPERLVKRWISRRIVATQIVFMVHMLSYYSFFVTLTVQPLFFYDDWTQSITIFGINIFVVGVLTVKRYGLIPTLCKSLNPIVELERSPFDETLRKNAAAELQYFLEHKNGTHSVNDIKVDIQSSRASLRFSPKVQGSAGLGKQDSTRDIGPQTMHPDTAVSEWLSSSEVSEALSGSVPAYQKAFEQAGVNTLGILCLLTPEDFRECGVSIGDRIRIETMLKASNDEAEYHVANVHRKHQKTLLQRY